MLLSIPNGLDVFAAFHTYWSTNFSLMKLRDDSINDNGNMRLVNVNETKE